MINATDLSKYYDDYAAVVDLSLRVDNNEVVGLLGRNGAGKTTTLRMLSGLLVPTCGSIMIDGIDMASDPERARGRIGFLPETPPLYPEMSVIGYLRFVARINGVHQRSQLEAGVRAALTAADLEGVQNSRIDTLSFGYRRRVGIAQAIVHRPALILLDEPTSGLDPVQVVQMRQLIAELRKQHTIVISSHILAEIHEMCDRILVLQDGRVVAEGKEDELRAHLQTVSVVVIEARAPEQALLQVVAKLDGISSSEVLHHSDDLVRVKISSSRDLREQLAAAVVEAGFGLRRLEAQDGGLEQLFLSLTSQSSAPTAVAAAEEVADA